MKREKTVLLIDDDQLYCQLQCIELEEMNLWDKIVCLESREEALEYLSTSVQNNTMPELIFMDLNMASMSTREFIDEIKRLSLETYSPRLIVTSALFNKEGVMELKSLGLEEMITKPITPEKINSLLSKIC